MKKQIVILFILLSLIPFKSEVSAEIGKYGDSTVERHYYPDPAEQTSVSQTENVQPGPITTLKESTPGGSLAGAASEAGWDISSVSGFGLPSGSIYSIIIGILNWLLALIGIIGVIGFLISGAMYILSSGNEKGAEKAKSAMTNSIIGVVVALAGYVIIQAVDGLLNAYPGF